MRGVAYAYARSSASCCGGEVLLQLLHCSFFVVSRVATFGGQPLLCRMADQDALIVLFSRLQELLAFAEEPPSLSVQQEDSIQSAFVLCMDSNASPVNAALYSLNHLIYCDGVAQPNRTFCQLFRLWFRLSSPRPSDDLQCIQALGSACVAMLSSFLSTKVASAGASADAALPLSRSMHDSLMSFPNPSSVVTLIDRFVACCCCCRPN